MNRDGLVQKLVELAGARIDIYYHSSTNTHIVCQRDEVVFSNFAIKGTGDFADDAHQNFLRNIETYCHHLSDADLQVAVDLCAKFPPSCAKKFELQVAIREEISLQARIRAKLEKKSLERFIEKLVSETLPEFASREDLSRWAERVKEVAERLHVESDQKDQLSAAPVALPLTRKEFEKIRAVVGSGEFDGFSHFFEDIIAFSFATQATEQAAVH